MQDGRKQKCGYWFDIWEAHCELTPVEATLPIQVHPYPLHPGKNSGPSQKIVSPSLFRAFILN